VVALRDGVVIGEGLTLRTSPDGAALGPVLEPGTPVQQLAVANGWRQVRLENGQRGWLPHDGVFVAEGGTP
jgi:SH3-like domain-containing protein